MIPRPYISRILTVPVKRLKERKERRFGLQIWSVGSEEGQEHQGGQEGALQVRCGSRELMT
jgi:hypothetical protein